MAALVPFGDLFNHNNPPDVVWSWKEDAENKNDFFMHATRDIAKGEEVFDSYGKLDNLKSLKGYGFIIPNNPVSLSVKLSFPRITLEPTDLFFTEKEEILMHDFEV